MSINVNLIFEILILIFFGFNFCLSDQLKNLEEIIVYPTIQDNHPSNLNDYHNYYSDYTSVLTNPRYHRSRYVPDVDKTSIFKFYKPENKFEDNYYQRSGKDLYELRSLNDDLNNEKRRVVSGEIFFEDIEKYQDEIIPRKLKYGIINRPSVIENFYNDQNDYLNKNPELIYGYPIRNLNNFPISVQRSYLTNKKRGLKSFTDEELEEIVNRASEIVEKKMLLINDNENNNDKGNSLIKEKFHSDYGNDRFQVTELNDPDASSQSLIIEEEKERPISIEEIDTKAIIAAAGGSDENDQDSTIMMDDDVLLLNEGEEVAEELASSSDSDNPDSDETIVDNNSTIETEGKEEEEEEVEEEEIETGEVQKEISGEEIMIDERLAEPKIAVIDDEE